MSESERTPPERVRVTKLQEAQLAELVQIDQLCVQMYYDIGVGSDQLAPRTDMEIGALTRNHDVLVAEADHIPAGYLAWADQAPGVAYIEWMAVHPDYQRFGIATRMLREVGEKASKHGIKVVATTAIDSAAWAMTFLSARGFALAAGQMPDTISSWYAQRETELVASGRKLWWAKSDGLGTIPGLPRPS